MTKLGPGEGRPFPNSSPTAHVKVESGAADFSAFESTVLANPIGVPLHRHRSYDEAFFVIEGEVDFVVGDRMEHASAGDFVLVPRGVAHRFANPGPGTSRMLVIGSPGVQALVEEAAPLVSEHPPDREAINAIFERHDSEFVGPPR
jgi:mannose-6-phosphate isomerase-like protein (cupin superfamily)